jgi:TctA family transporter
MDGFTFLALDLILIFVGTIVGMITGLIPGIHTNTVAAVLVVVNGPLSLGLSNLLGNNSLLEAQVALICFLVALAMAHIFVSYIPSTFLGAPDESTALSVLPGHRLLLQGRGMVALRLSAQGGLAAVFICVCSVLALRCIMGGPIDVYDRTRPFIPFLLVLVVLLMVMTEGRKGKKAHQKMVREPDTCLLVDEIRSSPSRFDSGPVLFHEVWSLWGSHGHKVRTLGVVVQEDDKLYLQDRTKVKLLVRNEAQRRFLEEHLGKEISIDGMVCRNIDRPKHTGLSKMIWAIALFLASGALGLVLLDCPGLANLNIIPVAQLGFPIMGWEFMPLFSGLFGVPTLLMSLSSNPSIPQQFTSIKETITRKEKAKGMVFGAVTGSFLGWFPAITSSEAALLASQASSDLKKDDDEESGGKATEHFMVTISAINASNAVANFVALFVILRTRSGAAKATQDILGAGLTPWTDIWAVPSQLALILVAVVVSSVLAYFMTLRIGKVFAEHFHKVPYRKLVLSILVLLVVLVVLMSGFVGLIILLVATLLGLIPPTVGVRRVHLIGCLIVPVLFSYATVAFGWGPIV